MNPRRRAPLLPALLLAAALGGCGFFGKTEEQTLDSIQTRSAPGRTQITIGELDQMSKNYADRLVARLSSACDRIKRETADEGLRTKAHQLKLTVALAAYDIVTSSGGSPHVPGAAQHIIDLAIITELEALHWDDEKAAQEQFAERHAELLLDSVRKSREDIWQLAGRLMSPDQIDRLKTMVAQWRAKNATVEWLARVRFDVIAQGNEGSSFMEGVRNSFNPLDSVLKSVDDIRMVAQQALFWAHRLPTLVDWTTESTVTNTLAVPKVAGLVRSLTETMGSLTHLSAQLEHLLAPSSQEPAINSTIQEVKETVVQANELVREIHRLEEAVHPFLEKSSDAPKKPPTNYEAVASKVDDAVRTTTSLVRETRDLAESPQAVRNVDELLGRVSSDLVRSGRSLVDHAIWGLVQVVLLIAVLVVVYKLVAYWLRKRRARAGQPGV